MSGKRSGSPERIRVLLDGWPLVYQNTGGTTHVLELIEALPESVDASVALPARSATLNLHSEIQVVTADEADTPAGRLRWDQSILPGLARKTGAQVLHTTSLDLALFSSVPCLVSPVRAFIDEPPGRGVITRLREALGRGGLANVKAILWPMDLPAPDIQASIIRLPPVVHSAFLQEQPALADLPDPYLLVPGPLSEAELGYLASVWRWITSGIGEEWTLLVSDIEEDGFARLGAVCGSLGILNSTTRYIPKSIQARASMFQQAAVILHISPVRPWGDGLLQSLACARPLAGVETPWADARAGAAGYLIPDGDPRGLGAAVITMAVEEEVAEQLSAAARQRAEAWQQAAFKDRLAEIYHRIVAGKD